MSADQILLARQPIFDAHSRIIAYELLFAPARPHAPDWDGDAATSQVIVNAFTEIGIDQVADNKPAFINFTKRWILDPPAFDTKKIVIEVLETVDIDDEVLAALRSLHERGYEIALDDFVYQPSMARVLDFVSIVKIDVLAHDKKVIEEWVDLFRKYNLRLVAEKVETHEMMEYCRELKFDAFQGFFLCRPQSIKGKSIPASRLVVMQLLTELQNPDADIGQLELLISRDPTLTYRLLKVFNSASYAMPTKVNSIRRAITLLGINKLKSWASLIALSQLSDKPHALMLTAIIRAKMCELLGSHSIRDADPFFTVGLFSTLDAFFDRGLPEVLANLPLDEDLNQALLHHEGKLGKVLQSVIAHEQADWEHIDWQTLEEMNINRELLEQSYLESIRWATSVCHSVLE